MPKLGENFKIIGTVVEQKIAGEGDKKQTVLKIEESDGNAFPWRAWGTSDWKGIAVGETYQFNVIMKDNPEGKYGPWRNLLKPLPVPATMPPSGEMTSRLGDGAAASSPAPNGSNGRGDDAATVARIIAFGQMRNRREALKLALDVERLSIQDSKFVEVKRIIETAATLAFWIEEPLQGITQDAQATPDATPKASNGTSTHSVPDPVTGVEFSSTDFWTWIKAEGKSADDVTQALGQPVVDWIAGVGASWNEAGLKVAEALKLALPGRPA